MHRHIKEDFHTRGLGLDPVPHGPVAALALVPHPQQGRMAGVHEVDDPQVGLAGVFPMQTPGVLLECALLQDTDMASTRVPSGGWSKPAPTNQLADRQERTRRVGRQRIRTCHQRRVRHTGGTPCKGSSQMKSRRSNRSTERQPHRGSQGSRWRPQHQRCANGSRRQAFQARSLWDRQNCFANRSSLGAPGLAVTPGAATAARHRHASVR